MKNTTISASTHTHTKHMIVVDLVHVLANIDPADEVVVSIQTPSGRPKRVAIGGGLLVSPPPPHEDW